MLVILRTHNNGITFRHHFPKKEQLKEPNFAKEHSSIAIISENPVTRHAKSSDANPSLGADGTNAHLLTISTTIAPGGVHCIWIHPQG